MSLGNKINERQKSLLEKSPKTEKPLKRDGLLIYSKNFKNKLKIRFTALCVMQGAFFNTILSTTKNGWTISTATSRAFKFETERKKICLHLSWWRFMC